MADYFSLAGLELPGQQNKRTYGSGATAGQYLQQLQNQRMLNEFNRSNMAQQAWEHQKARIEWEQKQKEANALDLIKQSPEYQAAFRQATLNEMNAKAAKAGLEGITSELGSRDITLAPSMDTTDPKLAAQVLASGKPYLQKYGLSSGWAGNPVEQLVNDRYRRTQEFRSEKAMQDDRQQFEWQMLLQRMKAEKELANIRAAYSGKEDDGLGVFKLYPSNLRPAALLFTKLNGRMPSTEEDLKWVYNNAKGNPAFDPTLFGEKQEAGSAGKITGALGAIKGAGTGKPATASVTPPFKGPQQPRVVTSKGGVQFTVQ